MRDASSLLTVATPELSAEQVAEAAALFREAHSANPIYARLGFSAEERELYGGSIPDRTWCSHTVHLPLGPLRTVVSPCTMCGTGFFVRLGIPYEWNTAIVDPESRRVVALHLLIPSCMSVDTSCLTPRQRRHWEGVFLAAETAAWRRFGGQVLRAALVGIQMVVASASHGALPHRAPSPR